MLMLGRNMEVAENQGNDENVVHRERQLDEITGNKLERLFFTTQGLEGHGEQLFVLAGTVGENAPFGEARFFLRFVDGPLLGRRARIAATSSLKR